MATIPARELVDVIPNVLSAGGAGLVMNGLALTHNDRLPVGAVLAFPNDGISVSSYFGAGSAEAEAAAVYFNGYIGRRRNPGYILMAQFPAAARGAWLRSGPVNTLTLNQLKAINGSLAVVVNGALYSNNSLNLSAATSYSAAAGIIETALNDTLPEAAEVTGAIAAGTAEVVGSIAGNILTVTAVNSGVPQVGALLQGTGISAGTTITNQLSGTPGGVGTYAVSIEQEVVSTTITVTWGVLTVSAVASGTISVGQALDGAEVTAGTIVTALGTGEGGTGTYIVNLTQTATSATINATGAPLDVSYDSVSGGFIIESTVAGDFSTIEYATGTTAAALFMTEVTGAILSQGALAQTPGEFMTNLIQETQNWGTFSTLFDPDGESGENIQKMLFAEWANDQNNRYAYVPWDTSVAPAVSNNALGSLGALVRTANLSGICVVYDPTVQWLSFFVMGYAASLNFQTTNGRTTLAFRGQNGLTPTVTAATEARNLIANGYNFYGAYATANQAFIMMQPGQISGQFQWADSFINQIWLNNALQQALMILLTEAPSVPYNQGGYDLIKAACADPINAALNFGAIRTGVTLSEQQAALVNDAAGAEVADVLQNQGWYLQVKDAAPQTRQERGSPPILFWYMDGQSVQKIVLTSTLVQ